MDEVLLNDLLECSVCLERLDTSSRVLPCQHTFCLKCLQVIVESHKELRCPECRILVETKVEDLPPNVLLMRILEGMRNSAPRRTVATTQRTPRSGHSQTHQGVLQQSARNDSKQLPPHARAMYDYISNEPNDLSFKKGETILLQKKLDPFWYQGECSGRTGMFPITYVQVVVPLPIPTALCKALYDFRMSAPDEEGCLAFDKGAIITVHRRVDENWAEGRLEHRVGIFPIAFVELNQAARQLINCTTLNRLVPPLPDAARPVAGHSDHKHHTQHQHSHRYQQMSLSAPATGQVPFASLGNLTQSHPSYGQQMVAATQAQILLPQPVNHQQGSVSHGGLVTTTAVPRNIVEPSTKHSIDLIHFTNMNNKSHHSTTMGIQSLSRIGESYDRLRSVKYDYSATSTAPVNKTDTTYQNIRTHEHFPVSVANFNSNNLSSDSSSSMNTSTSVGISSTTTPNTSSNTSTCESAEPSLPSSPDNNMDRNTTVIANSGANVENNDQTVNNDTETSLNTSMGVLSLNESSTATNTSLNVTLPPSESPKLESLNSSSLNHSETANESATSNTETINVVSETPSSSKSIVRSSGPDSLLNFGLGLQAALSPSHGKDGNYMVTRSHRDHHHREREKRHSLTPSTHLQGNHTPQNRHSAEILATSLLDHTPERERERPERERERRRRRSRSNERPLPASYIAIYPYKPQKPDELELKKGGMYTVTERCRDGWYKGCSDRSQRAGVFPGNYVAPAPHVRPKHDKNTAIVLAANIKPQTSVAPPTATLAPPDAPPRANSPHNSQAQPLTYPWSAPAQPLQATPRPEKSKEKQPKNEKASPMSTGVYLMKRLAAMKKCKSPPPGGFSLDNPVFEEGPVAHPHPHPHPVHVRANQDGLWQSQHRKSQSLDVTVPRKDRHQSQTVKERFRCMVPYPPNSEYELELRVGDIVIVTKKRGDGWYKGTLQRTGQTGLFPASFVQSCPQE